MHFSCGAAGALAGWRVSTSELVVVNRRRIILLAAIIVVTGMIVAMRFQKPDLPTSESTGWASAGSAAPNTVADQNSSPTPAAPTASSSFEGRIENAAESKMPATMSGALAELDRQVFPLGSPPEGSRIATNSPPPTASSFSPPRQPAASIKPLVELGGREQSHRIADGDTLDRLAERYLGRADRSLELYDYNRDVLSRPDVLPIGAELRIPPLVPVQVTAPISETKSSTQNAASSNLYRDCWR
jgi:nucleoid-associated protein YgaU